MPPRILLGGQALPAPETWWLVRASSNVLLAPADSGRRSSHQEFVDSTSRVPLDVLQDAFSQLLDMERPEARAWNSTWQAIVRRADWERQQSGRSATQSRFAADAETLLAIEDALSDDQRSVDEQSRYLLNYPPLAETGISSSVVPSEFVFVGDEEGRLSATVSLASSGSLWRWFAAAALVSGVLAVVLRLRRHPDYYHQLCHWPHSLAVAGGVAWWLLLDPSALGLLVIAIAGVSQLLTRWRAYRQTRQVSRRRGLAASTG